MSNYNVCLYCGRVIGYADPTMPAYCNLGCQFKAEAGPSIDWQKNFESSLVEFQERVRKRFEERRKERKMKSKCCNAEVVVFTSKERTSYYVCGKCKQACDVACEPLTEPKFVGRWQGEDSKDSLEMALTAKVLRLTPEQWTRVRWPDMDQAHEGWLNDSFGIADFAHWAISYALQDLKPEEEAIEDLDKLLEGEE